MARREPECLLCDAHNFSHPLRFNNGLPDTAGRIEVVLKLNRLWLGNRKTPENLPPKRAETLRMRTEPEWALGGNRYELR